MIQQQIHQHTWSEHLIWWLTHQFGTLIILACIFTGAIVLVMIIFRKWITDKFGTAIEWADNFINRKKS